MERRPLAPTAPRLALRLARATVALAVLLGAAMASFGSFAGCDSSSDSASSNFDVGPTFGIEVTLTVQGRGRVVSDPVAIDCPTQCFARLTLVDRTFDGSDVGFGLTATASAGSHFVGWTYNVMTSGTRAAGPSDCSPMTRSTLAAPPPDGAPADRESVYLTYGETEGTPPLGHETECAPFTTVPVAYALTATFEEDTAVVQPPPAPGPPVEVLFEPPALGTIVGREIAVRNGKVYWRFDGVNSSGIAIGRADGTGGGSTLLFPANPGDMIQSIDLGRHIVFEHGDQLETIDPDTGIRTFLSYFSQCVALTSDDLMAYCRYASSGNNPTYLYTFSLSGGGYTFEYTLPPGVDLAVDQDHIYFSDTVQSGGATGQATVESAPRVSDGGFTPVVTKLVAGQTLPRSLTVNATNLFWLDQQAGDLVTVNSAPKTGADSGTPITTFGTQFLVIDPFVPGTFWAGVSESTTVGSSYILQGTLGPDGFTTTFRSGLTGLGGLAVDSAYVYWTQSDGRVYRAPRP